VLEILHEISVAFGCSTNLHTLIFRLGDGLLRHLPIVEIESARLLRRRGEVRILAYDPRACRRWEGVRSSRFIETQRVNAPIFVSDELARVAITPVATKLKLPVGRVGVLAIAFETDISLLMGSRENTDILVDTLALHCLRLGQLLATAERCNHVHREIGEMGRAEDARSNGHRYAGERAQSQFTEIPVTTLDAALIDCIGAALAHSGGKIYGPDGAAAVLGLKPSTLQSKMRKLGIERTNFTQA
jgi:hypothetical protein